MAGFTKRLAYSLRWRLAVGLSLLVSAVALVAGAVTYRTAFKEAHALQDAQLKHIAMLIGSGSPILRSDMPPQPATVEPRGFTQDHFSNEAAPVPIDLF